MAKLYVGNISFATTEEQLEALFAEYGTVDRVYIITDRQSGRPRGFGFVEMPDDSASQAAIDGLNGKEVDGRALTVNEARAKPERGDGGGGGRRRY